MLEQMTNVELLSTLAGKPGAQELLERYGSLSELNAASVDEIRQSRGIGPRRALAIKSALTLACRMSREARRDAPLLDTPEAVANLLREENRAYGVEHFQVVLVNTRRRLIRTELVARGSLDSVVVTAREVFFAAIAARAAALILVHNHPSGDPAPSTADMLVTRELTRAGRLLKIEVLDHIILGHRTLERPRDYVSMRELGYMIEG